MFREQRDTESVMAFFERALRHSGGVQTHVETDYHLPYIRAIQEVLPAAVHIWTGLHWAHGETTAAASATTHERARAVGAALQVLGARLTGST